MTDVLFKGKQKYCNDTVWVEGAGFNRQYDAFGNLHMYIGVDVYSEKEPKQINIEWIEILPETLSRFTGLTDKNNVKIFSSDIVKTQMYYDRPYSKNRKGKRFIGVVEYNIRTFGGNSVYVKQDYHAEWGLKFNESFGNYIHGAWSDFFDCEVIGNIFDNPELLEVQNEERNG